VRQETIVADLKKDYFLMCKKKHLARTSSAKSSRKPTSLETSCSANSPTSPCQWNAGFSRLQQLDSVFDGDVRSTIDFASSVDDDAKEVGWLVGKSI